MAQALCGPSNALQNLQKHASTDRTLQQDRLVSSHPSSQNFRSHIPSDVLAADAELAAFESGIAAAPRLAGPAPGPAAFAHNHHAPPPPPPFAFAPQPLTHPAESSWANDFQQLSISGGPQAPIQHDRVHSLPFRTASGGWQDEFLQQQQQQQIHHVASPSHASQRLFGTVGAMRPMSTMSQYSMYNPVATLPRNSTETLDDAAFEAAFAEARAEVDQLDKQSADYHQHKSRTELRLDINQDAGVSEPQQQGEKVRIAADTIQDTGKNVVDQNDDLARTAGQLLESVQHETNQKFKESNFLALMRQLRDREVVVDGGEFRQVEQPLHPGGEFYPEGRRPSAEPVADEAEQKATQPQSQSQSQPQPQQSFGTS
ncbi:hypothetical protein KEM54_003306 [Ascosphaera aggregata]|nr:hypothetical protein KEM54_003306 [Ascosphaera aggregata]